MRRKVAVSAEDITTPCYMTCAKCGGQAIGYPAPDPPRGVCFCPCTSPAWLKSFAEFATADLREKRGLPREFTIKAAQLGRGV